MRIEHRLIGDVCIIDLNGTLAEREHVQALRSRIESALESGVKKIVFNLEKMSYINSTGLGAVVYSYALVRKAGAHLVLCHPTKRVTDLFSITKLITLFEIYASVEDALHFYADGTRLQVTCPRSGPEGWIPFSPLSEYQQCPLCGIELKVSSPLVNTSTAVAGHVTAFRLPTYDGECISVVIGAPTFVSIDGRLDVFAAEAIEQAVRLIPAPCSLVFSLGTNDISEAGMAALVRLCEADAGSRTAISLNGIQWQDKQRWQTAHAALIYDAEDEAVRAIEPVSAPAALNVSVRRSDI